MEKTARALIGAALLALVLAALVSLEFDTDTAVMTGSLFFLAAMLFHWLYERSRGGG